MGLFSSGRKDTSLEASTGSAASGTAITYDPHLVEKLTTEHKALLALYGSIAQALEKSDLNRVNELLRKFKVMLQEHLLLENLRLYAYLSRHLADDDSRSKIINDFRSEMTEIGWTVVDFLRRYADEPIPEGRIFKFREEFDRIGGVLVSRIEREEKSLYTLYLESY